jgi:hypothetical protein
MPRIIYLCPADNVPTGGIKVIYRHAALLSDLGAEAFVLHPFEASFRCDWFEHRARFLDSLTLHPSSDLVVIPELWAGIFGPQCLRQAVRYAVFVQNGYLTHPVLPQHSAALMEHVYRSADLVLAISDDSARMVTLNYPGIDQARVVRARYSVGERFLSPALLRGAPGRARAITFMPRKMADHAVRVVFALRQHLPAGWQIIPIANVNEAACAAMLFGSRISWPFRNSKACLCRHWKRSRGTLSSATRVRAHGNIGTRRTSNPSSRARSAALSAPLRRLPATWTRDA